MPSDPSFASTSACAKMSAATHGLASYTAAAPSNNEPATGSDSASFFSKQVSAFEQEAKELGEEQKASMWKNFGCDTAAGRALRSLYAKHNSAHAINTKISKGVKLRSSSRSKMDLSSRTDWDAQEKGSKKCPQRDGKVPIPRVGMKKADGADPNQQRTRGKKSLDQIRAENDDFVEGKSGIGIPRGRDNDRAKQELQNKFTYGNAYLTPSELKNRRQLREDEEAVPF
eukprot:g3503.t1